MVWSLIKTLGGLQTFDFDKETVSLVTIGSAAMLALQLFLQRQTKTSPTLSHRQKVTAKIGITLIALAVITEKSVLAWADAKQFKSITSRARLFPLYQVVGPEKLTVQLSG
jgi:membrane-anchored protein YejM (alkaline phosphatase superfamily)